MTTKKKIIFPVLSDLNQDQRMIRICTSLTNAGFDVLLIGPKWPKQTNPLLEKPYRQLYISLPMRSSKLMYLIFWWKVFFYVMRHKVDILGAIDLDTVIPVYFASKLKKNCIRIYDAHEIFTEMQEVNSRKNVKRLWEWIGKKFIPKFPHGYTISPSYAAFFKEKYGVNYSVVRNATILRDFKVPEKKNKIILYQGAVNKGRAFEYLIPAMKLVESELWIVGFGNFMDELQELILEHKVENKVKLLGRKPPEELKKYTEQAWIGITLFDNSENGISNYLSMANRFFDYMHHGVPQIACDFPEYRLVNEEREIAYLVRDLHPETIAEGLNKLLHDEEYHSRLSENAMIMREKYCWQEEEKTLHDFYQKLFSKLDSQ